MKKPNHYKRFVAAAVAAAGLSLAACGGGDSSAETGSLNLGMTDAPVDDASKVVVQFDGVELKPQGGKTLTYTFDPPRQVEISALQDGAREMLLEGVELPAGRYNYIRLMVTASEGAPDSYLTLESTGDAMYPLHIPSGDETGLKLVSGFVIPVNGTLDFTIDFDLRKSVYKPMSETQDYRLKPALRIVQTDTTGAIAGTIDWQKYAAVTEPDTSCAVYVYEGAGVTPDDEGSATSPVASAQVKMDDETGEYKYRVAYLMEGAYTTALTCQAGVDDPETDDDVLFDYVADATVTAKQTSQVNFP